MIFILNLLSVYFGNHLFCHLDQSATVLKKSLTEKLAGNDCYSFGPISLRCEIYFTRQWLTFVNRFFTTERILDPHVLKYLYPHHPKEVGILSPPFFFVSTYIFLCVRYCEPSHRGGRAQHGIAIEINSDNTMSTSLSLPILICTENWKHKDVWSTFLEPLVCIFCAHTPRCNGSRFLAFYAYPLLH